MPKQHRRTYGAIFEVMLASAFTLLPFIAGMLAHNPEGFRLIALPGGLTLGIVPLLVHFGLPESARWYLRRGDPQKAMTAVNEMIARCGNRVSRLSLADLGSSLEMGQRTAATLQGFVRRGPVALDRDRHRDLCVGNDSVLLLGDPAAQGAGGPGCRSGAQLRADRAAVPGDHPRQVLHRLHHGDHRAALDDHLLPRRCDPGPRADGGGAYAR